MGDDSSRSIIKSLRNEWSLFLEAFQGEEEPDLEKNLDIDEIRHVTKILLADRKLLNQKLESLSKEIDLNTAKLESLRLGGVDESAALARVHELHDNAEGVAMAMEKLDRKLREIRDDENQFNEEILS